LVKEGLRVGKEDLVGGGGQRSHDLQCSNLGEENPQKGKGGVKK